MPARYAKGKAIARRVGWPASSLTKITGAARARGANGSITVPGTPLPYITLNVAMIDDAQTQCDEGPWNQFSCGHQHQRCVEPDTPDDDRQNCGLGAGGADHQQPYERPRAKVIARPPCC